MNRDVLDEGEATATRAVDGRRREPVTEVFTEESAEASTEGSGGPPNLVPEAQPRNILAGRIELLDKIGEGGMGVVWRGHHLKLDRPVAVKVLDETLQLRTDGRERFIREARALALLDHRNVVRIHDCDQLPDGKLFLCMELLDGETLRQVIRGGERPDPLEVIDIGLQACDAIHAAHEHGILHRDLTPSNIVRLRDPARTIKIIDWGLCKYLDLFYVRSPSKYGAPPGSRLVTPLGCRFGTPEYMAPEMIARDSPHPPSFGTDVYALGVVLYELLTGRHPFTPGDRKQPRPIRDFLPDFDYHDLESALRAALRPDPDDRIPTMAELREALDLARECLLAQRHDAATSTAASSSTARSAAARLRLLPPLAGAAAVAPTRPRGRLSLVTLALLLGAGLGTAGTLTMQRLGQHDAPTLARVKLGEQAVLAALATSRADRCEATATRAAVPTSPPAPPPGSIGAPTVLAAAGETSAEPQPRPRARATPVQPPQSFDEAMRRLEPKIRECARQAGLPEAPATVQVRRRDGVLDKVKVLRLGHEHPFTVCVDAIVRQAPLPASDYPIKDFTYFR